MKSLMKNRGAGVALFAVAVTFVPAANILAEPTTANTPEGETDAASVESTKHGAEANSPAMLFVIGPNMGFVGFDNAETLSGTKVAVTSELKLGRDTVLQPRDAVLDSRGALYLLSSANGGSVAVYDNPFTATGSRAPDRIVFGDKTQISRSPSAIAIDRENDLLYVANTMSDTVVFDISSPESFSGDIAPVRTFDVDVSQFKPEQMRFANGSLYMVDARGGTSDILVFDEPGELQGKVSANCVITHAEFDNKIGIDVDASDRLIVSVRKSGQVLIFNNASKLDGIASPDVALSIADTKVKAQPSYATIDSHDRLFVADANGNVTFSFDRASELASGKHRPDRTIGSRELIAPNRLLVVERAVQ